MRIFLLILLGIQSPSPIVVLPVLLILRGTLELACEIELQRERWRFKRSFSFFFSLEGRRKRLTRVIHAVVFVRVYIKLLLTPLTLDENTRLLLLPDVLLPPKLH